MLLAPLGGPIWAPFGARDGGPGRPKSIFVLRPQQRPRDLFCFQVVSGVAFGSYLDVFFGYLEMYFMDGFEKALVFVRCVNSILTPVFLLSCYRYGRTSAILLAQVPCHVNMSVLFSGCCASTCVYVCFSCF